jgi:PAS domain S-box-containing protein
MAGADSGARPTSYSLRAVLIAYSFAVVLPVLILTGYLLNELAAADRAALEQRMVQMADALREDIDREIERRITLLTVLATSPALAQGDYATFHRHASAASPEGAVIALVDASLQQLVNTFVPYGTPLPLTGDSEGVRRIFDAKRPWVSDYFIGRVSRRPVFNVDVPVFVGGQVRYALLLGLDPGVLLPILEEEKLPREWGITVADRKGVVLARRWTHDQSVGKQLPDELRQQRPRPSVVTSLDGERELRASAVSPVSGWQVSLNVPLALARAPLQRNLWWWGGMAAAAFVLATGLAAVFARTIARPLQAAARAAAGLGRGAAVPEASMRLTEVDSLLAALREADRDLAQARDQRDEAQRQAAARELDASERRFQLLVQGVTDYAIFLLDPEGYVTNWNTGAARIKGYSSDEIVGQHFSRFYTEEDRANDLPARALRTAANEGKYEAEGWRVRKDGKRFWASVIIDAIHDESGKLTGFAKVTRDLTEKRETQQQLETAREHLFQSQKMEAVGQLTGGVAHDFNNLLTIILGNLDAAKRALEGWTEGAQARLVRAVDHATLGAQRAATLTRQLLAFSRRQALEPTFVDVNRLLVQLLDFLRRSLGETVEIETVGAGGIWSVEVDQAQLEAAILNLALNARDAMSGAGKLTLEASNTFLDEDYRRRHPDVKVGQYVLIAVTDNGTGMTSEIVERAFEPFFSTKEPGRGTGLGLSQVYGFVKQSGGHVKIYSEPGQGTTVKIYLPRVHRPATAVEEQEPPPPPTARSNEVVLVVEDDADVRRFICETLRDLHYTVREAVDAASALAVIDSAEKIDLLLTDVILPGPNGRALANQALARRPGLKVLFMTGYSRNAIVHHGRLDPGVEVIHKPLTQAALAAKVRDVLDSRG